MMTIFKDSHHFSRILGDVLRGRFREIQEKATQTPLVVPGRGGRAAMAAIPSEVPCESKEEGAPQ